MSETKFYVVENIESLWNIAKKHWAHLFLDQRQKKHESRKHVWICECCKYTGDRQRHMIKIRDVYFSYFS